jgi:hypothetical protein
MLNSPKSVSTAVMFFEVVGGGVDRLLTGRARPEKTTMPTWQPVVRQHQRTAGRMQQVHDLLLLSPARSVGNAFCIRHRTDTDSPPFRFFGSLTAKRLYSQQQLATVRLAGVFSCSEQFIFVVS